MHTRLLLAAPLAILLASPIPATRATVTGPAAQPRFEDYPANASFTGRGRLVLGSSDRGYRTRLREAARGRPDFAGQYVLALWGCGAECVMGAAVDLRSGRVTWLPGTICCWHSGNEAEAEDVEPVRYRRDSRLIILNGMRNEREGDLGTHYYAIRGGRFIHLLDRPSGAGKP